ncbi:Hypothetical predicted protein [Mytilus galloprovincialis]|uniref:PLAT domain-containing protein n=1 Tax=Mytilus galloprovincialis TaxID=29158 RepID=A0A8B6E2Z7_MYTGA|nr:Hypothetical predicted protein [Mytilus galloprovincialis]
MVCVSDICDCEIPAMQYHDSYDKSCKAMSTYNENCSTQVGDASCYNDMVCNSGICDCEIPATQYHDPYDKSCKAMSTYNDNCTTLVGDSTCYNNMVCVSDICDCEIPAMQYHDPYAKSCEAIRTYKDNCSTLVGDSTCFNNMVCVSGTCDCEIPAMQYYVFYDKSCKTRAKYKESCQALEDGSNCYGNMICVSGVCGCNTTQYYNPNVHSCNETSFNAEEFVNDTKGFGNVVEATMDSIHHMHIEIKEKEHIIEEMVTVLAVLPTENEAEMENVLEASNQISKEADALSDNVQDALLNVMDKISDQISHTDINKSEPGKVENMVKSLFDSSSNLLDLNHVPERHTVKEKVIVEDKSETETENVKHVEETEPEQEVPYESPEEQQETQVQETEAEIKAREKKIERTKKLLHTVDIIADSALKTLSDDEPKTMEFSTKTMNLVVGVSKLNNSTNTSTDISTSRKIGNKTVTSSFKLPPEIKEQLKEASKNGFKFQMLFSDKNPRSWDKSSAYINSPMISLILKDLNQKTLNVTKLPKPIIIDIPIGRNEKFSEFILNSQEDNFIRLKVKQPANMFYMLKLMTDGPQYNMSVKIAIEFHKQVSLSDAENGTLISNTQIAFLKEPEKKSLYWSIGLIVNDRRDGNISQNISVKISSTGINCRYWNNTIGKWVPEGCRVSPVSSSETLECECDHLTDFAGGVFVLPNIMDPFQDALLFLTFFDNPVVVTDGIVTPFPSDPSDPFKYLMCIVTGWRYDARTTANVSCYIKGNNGQSARHCLSRTSSPQVLFTSGGEDWFLITSSYNIGDMVNVIVWHDNSGSSPSWFLSRIIIQDLQTKKVFNFYYDNWLGIQSGTAKVCLSIKSGYELKQQFFLRTSQDLRRGHLWISIISKPPCSNFTRAQRLSCALSLLFCTMLSCLMFHGIPTDETISSDVASIQFEFSLKDFIIGLESSIIMFPINFAIIELFVRSKTKQLHKERYLEIDVNRPTTSDEKGSDKTDNEIVAVKRWMFPWWVIYIAWTTTILTSLVSSYFVMLYGLKYGYYESLNWLVSFLTAFVDDVFLMEPISVVFFAMLFTFILKREIKIDSAPALIVHKPERNNALMQKRSNTKSIIPGHASKKDLRKAKQELDLKEKIQTNLQDILLYVFFTFMLLFVVHSHRPVEKCFMQSQDINNIFIQNTLEHVKTRGDIWTYINESVIPPLSKTIPYDMSKKIPENDFLLIGKFRLRQIRVKRDSCKFPDKLRKLFGLDHLDMKCTSTLNTVNDDNDNYNKSWQIQSQLVTPTDEWSFQNAWDLESVPYLGERAIYGGAFACCGHLLFGASLAGYRSFADSLMVLIECTFRIVNYNQYLEFHPQLGPLFILLFIFIFVFGLMNMFTVIVMNAQKSLRQKGVKHDDQLTLLIKYAVQSIRRMFR